MQLAVFAINQTYEPKLVKKIFPNQGKMEAETQEVSDNSEIPRQEEHCKLHMGSICRTLNVISLIVQFNIILEIYQSKTLVMATLAILTSALSSSSVLPERRLSTFIFLA